MNFDDFKEALGEANDMLDKVAKPGIRRLIIRKLIPVYTPGRVLDKILNKGDSVEDALVHEGKEIFCEDTPVLNLVYDTGKNDGKKDGYQEASDIYEKKLVEQAAMFIKQKNYQERQELEYNHLLQEYDVTINNLRHKLNKTELENKKLQEWIEIKDKLCRLPKL